MRGWGAWDELSNTEERQLLELTWAASLGWGGGEKEGGPSAKRQLVCPPRVPVCAERVCAHAEEARRSSGCAAWKPGSHWRGAGAPVGAPRPRSSRGWGGRGTGSRGEPQTPAPEGWVVVVVVVRKKGRCGRPPRSPGARQGGTGEEAGAAWSF